MYTILSTTILFDIQHTSTFSYPFFLFPYYFVCNTSDQKIYLESFGDADA